MKIMKIPFEWDWLLTCRQFNGCTTGGGIIFRGERPTEAFGWVHCVTLAWQRAKLKCPRCSTFLTCRKPLNIFFQATFVLLILRFVAAPRRFLNT